MVQEAVVIIQVEVEVVQVAVVIIQIDVEVVQVEVVISEDPLDHLPYLLPKDAIEEIVHLDGDMLPLWMVQVFHFNRLCERSFTQ